MRLIIRNILRLREYANILPVFSTGPETEPVQGRRQPAL